MRRYTQADEEEWTCGACGKAWREALSANCAPCNDAIRAGEDMADDDDG